MLKYLFLVFFRGVRKKPVYTIVNVLGLAIGIASCIIITFYVVDELSYDEFHEQSDHLYRITQTQSNGDDLNTSATTPFPLREALLRDYPDQISDVVRFFDMQTEHVSIGNPETRDYFNENRFFLTDPGVFEIFDFELVRGNPETVLSDPLTAVITEQTARKYFGDADPVGKELHFDGRLQLTVTGVMEECPPNSHFQADILISFESLRHYWGNYDQIVERWRWNPNWTYVLFHDHTNIQQFEHQLTRVVDSYYDGYFASGEEVSLNLQPITDIRLHSNLENEIEPTRNANTVYLFAGVAILIFIVACINFMNLATATSTRRAREIGLRKTMGATRSMLTRQFLLESYIQVLAGVLIAVAIAALALPYFNQFTGKALSFSSFGYGWFLLVLTAILIGGGLVAGLYPAFVLSSFNPAETLKADRYKGKSGKGFQKALVVFQFGVTTFLLIGAGIVYSQHQFLQEKELGFDKEQVVVIPVAGTLTIWRYDEYKTQLLRHSGIKNVSGSKTVMASPDYFKHLVVPEGYGDDQQMSISMVHVMHDFLETMDIELLAGRDFSHDFSTDPEQAVLINRKMAEHLDWLPPETAVGKTLQINESDNGTVVGVTEDFHFTHLRNEMEPLVMNMPESQRSTVVNIEYMKVRLNTGNPSDAIAHMQEAWNEMGQPFPFDYFFLDDKLDQIYEAEENLSTVITIFTILGIFIACIGLFGLSSYSVSTRRKEIGIRKSMGATATQIFSLLAKDYLKLIVIANIIALPLIYYLGQQWLQDFPYRIDLSSYLMIIFPASILVTALISLLTISHHSIKAALLNPVHALRSE